jgi:hypothetical protein
MQPNAPAAIASATHRPYVLGLCLWLASDYFFSPLAALHPPWSRFFVGSLPFYPRSWQKNATQHPARGPWVRGPWPSHPAPSPVTPPPVDGGRVAAGWRQCGGSHKLAKRGLTSRALSRYTSRILLVSKATRYYPKAVARDDITSHDRRAYHIRAKHECRARHHGGSQRRHYCGQFAFRSARGVEEKKV